MPTTDPHPPAWDRLSGEEYRMNGNGGEIDHKERTKKKEHDRTQQRGSANREWDRNEAGLVRGDSGERLEKKKHEKLLSSVAYSQVGALPTLERSVRQPISSRLASQIEV